MHHGGPAAGDGEQVAGELFDARGEFAVVVDAPDGDAAEALLTGGVGDGAADQHPRAGRGRCGGRFAQLRTGVHDGLDADAGGPEVGGQGVGAVVGSADDHPGTGGHGVAVEVAADRGGEHDAGAVVVFEDQRAFVGAGGQDDLGGADVPDPLAGHSRRGRRQEVVRPVLGRDDVVGVVGAEGTGAVQDRALGCGDQFGFNVGHPVQGGDPFDGLREGRIGGSGQQRAAQFGLVVNEDDPGAATDGFAGRGQACRPAADHEDVGVDVLLVVLGAVLFGIQLAEPVEQFGAEPVHEGHRGGGEHGFGHVPREPGGDLDQGVGFLDAGGHDAARPVLVQGVAGAELAVRQQGGGEGVAGVAREFTAIHGEAPGDAAVNASAGAEARGLRLSGHLLAPSGETGLGSVGAVVPVAGRSWPIGYTAWMS